MDAAETQIFVDRSVSRSTGAVARARSLSLGSLAFYGAVVIAMAAAVPNGTVEVWHASVVIVAIAFIGFIRIADGCAVGAVRVAEPAILVPMAGVLILAVSQCVPFPFLGTTISVDPYETRSFILVFGSLIVCGEVLFTYTDSIRRLKVLSGAVIATALLSALFGFLWEVLAAADYNVLALYIRPHQGYAQFINRNHFAVLVEMALGLLVGLLLKAELTERVRFLGWVAGGFLIYSMVAASSRGGLVSLAGLAVFAVFLHVFTREPKDGHGSRRKRSVFGRIGVPPALRKLFVATGIGVLVLGFIVLMIAFVGGDQLAGRFEKVDTEIGTYDHTRTNRNLIWTSTLDLIADRPIVGAGFGAYETAITQFDRSSGKAALKQAHNEYLEILANGGIVGFLLFGIFGAVVVARLKRNIVGSDRERAAYAFGAAVGIFGVMIHSFVDFGLHVMVNALLFLVLIVVGAARVGPYADRKGTFGRKIL